LVGLFYIDMALISTFIPLFLTLFPLTISPGPANLLLASSGTNFGLRKTVPFMLGIFTIFALQSLLVGAGLAELLFRYPNIMKFFQYAGAAFLVYLAFHFFRAPAAEEAVEPLKQGLGFREGAFMDLLNFKAFAVQATMFSLFLDPARPKWAQVITLSLFLMTIGYASGLIWALGGDFLGRFLKTGKGAAWQGRVFGSVLLVVAVWMVIRA
jgi:homoserine/homoserine lactone efflux protein